MIEAINDKVVGVMLKREQTISGIIIPEAHEEPQAYVKVTSVGNKVEANIKVGDVIVAHQRAGMIVVFDRKIVRVLQENEIYGLLKDEGMLKTLNEIELTGGKTEGHTLIKPVSKPKIVT